MALRKPAGSECRIYVDGIPQLAEGHYLVTPGGTAYLVIELRPSRKLPWRRNLRCLRFRADDVPAGAVTWQLHWYKREKRKALPLSQLGHR